MIVELYVPAGAFAGMVRWIVGFQVAELMPFTPVATWTGPGGQSGVKSLEVTLAVPLTEAAGVM
ncbi:hypothetical protein ACFVRU_05020 [Streptomyces sp. NPDC057927]